MNAATTTTPPPAIPFDPSSPSVRRLPGRLAVHRLAIHLHDTLAGLGGNLPAVVSGWVQQEAAGYLTEARRNLEQAGAVIAAGARHHAADTEGSRHGH